MGYPAERTIVHSIGVDVERFKPPAAGRREKIRPVCRAPGGEEGLRQPDRGHGRGAAPRPAAELVVIGDGPLRADYEARAAALGVRCGFLGTQPTSRGAGSDGAGGVFCVPSVVAASGDAEGFGMVFIEAQAMGLPVVSTLSGGIPEAVKHGETGLLVTRGRFRRALARRFCADAGRGTVAALQRSPAGDGLSDHFNLARQTGRLENLFAQLLEGSMKTGRNWGN
jgi:colanic acid/amylovoran biosynthesis glycosyltransferase